MPAPPTTAAGDPDLQRLQRLRKHALRIGGALCVALILLTDSSWRDGAPHIYALIRGAGLLMILACIFGRTWCTLYIGGLKKRELVTLGPYSLVRNPLYAFTVIGVAGVGALAGSIALGLLFGAFALAVFAAVVRREEAFLGEAFGEPFAVYAQRVGRFWPRFSGWQEAEELAVRPRLVRRTFLDASLFLLAVPLMELRRLAQAAGLVPVLLHLP